MISKELQDYLEGLVPERTQLLQEMELFAKENGVPIMELVGIEALLQLLKIMEPKSILEIGAAIGYSAIRMATALPKTKVLTIERDEERISKAKEFIQRAGLENQIVLFEGDALDVEASVKSYAPFDVIFIDAAKGQYQRFFELYVPYLNSNGLIITDNVLFKGLVTESEIENKRIRSLVKKIDQFNHWLMNHPEFETAILPVGDGIAVSKKR